jgi:hypothetical protein
MNVATLRPDVWGPALTLAAASAALTALAPFVPVAAPLADLLAVAWAVFAALGATLVVPRGAVPASGRLFLAVAGSGVVLLALTDRLGLSRTTLGLQVGGLLLLSRGLGVAIGERIAHPGHVLPASVVAAAADVASVLSPEGPTNAIVASERALSVFALAAPVLGTEAVTLLLGVGDLVFVSMVVAVAYRHELGRTRVLVGALAGLVGAFAIAAISGVAVPALVTVAAGVVLVEPRCRVLPRAERRVALMGMAVAVTLVAAVFLRRALSVAP